MKKLNQKGFSALEALVVIVMIGLVVTVGWLVVDRQKSREETLTQTKDTVKPTTETPTPTTQSTVEKYESKELGFSFEYPKGWKLSTISGGARLMMRLESPDHTSQEGGYGGTLEGATILMLAGSDSTISHNSIDSILKGTVVSKSSYTEQKELSVAGVRGVQYKTQYEGPTQLTSQFDSSDKIYMFTLEEDIDGPSFNKYMAEYQALVNSFKVK